MSGLLKLIRADDVHFLGEIKEQPPGPWSWNNTKFGRYFRLNERGSNIIIEIRAGIVTFLAIAYILSVNANIIASSGGPCSSDDCTGADKSFSCRFKDPGYQNCVDETRKSLITATAASTLIACAIMGGIANLPLAISCGMGLNAYFTYNVVGYYGTGSVAYKDALAAIFVEGFIFIILSLCGARQFLIKMLPRTLSLSMSAGIGMFLAYIGLQAGEGLGVVVAEGATLGTLGACPVGHRSTSYFITDADAAQICTPPPGDTAPYLPAPNSAYGCDGHKMEDAAFWLGISGFALMCILMSRGFKGAIIVGILWVTFISWIPGHAASYLKSGSNLPGGIGNNGESRWLYFKKVVAAPTLSKTALQLDFAGMGNGDVWIALITFLYVDFCDCTGTLFSMANFISNYIPGFVDKDKNFPRSMAAYLSDGTAIVVGSLMGVSPLTVYIESATGIREGGRTGLTSLMTGACFFVSLFFAPLLASIPVFATGPALILVGALMMSNAAKVNWFDITKAVPAFLTIVIMPLTYSIAYGVIAGIVSYLILAIVTKVCDYLSPKCGGWLGTRDEHKHVDGPEARETTFRIHSNQADEIAARDSDDSVQNAKINNIAQTEMVPRKEEV